MLFHSSWPFSHVYWSNRQTPIVYGRPDRQQGMPIHVESQARNNLVGGHHLKCNPTRLHLPFWLIEYPNIIPSLPVKLNELMLQGAPGVGAIVYAADINICFSWQKKKTYIDQILILLGQYPHVGF
jgi:hypothetical protein